MVATIVNIHPQNLQLLLSPIIHSEQSAVEQRHLPKQEISQLFLLLLIGITQISNNNLKYLLMLATKLISSIVF